MKLVILGNDIFKLDKLEWCNHSEKCTYFKFSHREFIYGDEIGNIYSNFVIFIEDGAEVFHVEKILKLENIDQSEEA